MELLNEMALKLSIIFAIIINQLVHSQPINTDQPIIDYVSDLRARLDRCPQSSKESLAWGGNPNLEIYTLGTPPKPTQSQQPAAALLGFMQSAVKAMSPETPNRVIVVGTRDNQDTDWGVVAAVLRLAIDLCERISANPAMAMLMAQQVTFKVLPDLPLTDVTFASDRLKDPNSLQSWFARSDVNDVVMFRSNSSKLHILSDPATKPAAFDKDAVENMLIEFVHDISDGQECDNPISPQITQLSKSLSKTLKTKDKSFIVMSGFGCNNLDDPEQVEILTDNSAQLASAMFSGTSKPKPKVRRPKVRMTTSSMTPSELSTNTVPFKQSTTTDDYDYSDNDLLPDNVKTATTKRKLSPTTTTKATTKANSPKANITQSQTSSSIWMLVAITAILSAVAVVLFIRGTARHSRRRLHPTMKQGQFKLLHNGDSDSIDGMSDSDDSLFGQADLAPKSILKVRDTSPMPIMTSPINNQLTGLTAIQIDSSRVENEQ